VTLFEAIRENYRQLTLTLTRVEREVNRAVRENDRVATESLTKVQMLLVSIKSEAALLYVLHIPNGIPIRAREDVLAKKKAIDRWTGAIEAAFRFHYKVRPKQNLADGLEHDVLAKWRTLQELVDSELEPLIAIRNKLAHGQWATPLNTAFTHVEPGAMTKLRNENALTLKLRHNLIEQLTRALGDLIQSPITFESRFNMRYRRIRDNRAALATADYGIWVASVRATRRTFPALVEIYARQNGWRVVDREGRDVELC
jgi:hypothetical protein